MLLLNSFFNYQMNIRQLNILHRSINLLGHKFWLHDRVSSKHSLHWLLLIKQVRLRFCIPVPHVAEHTLQSDVQRRQVHRYWRSFSNRFLYLSKNLVERIDRNRGSLDTLLLLDRSRYKVDHYFSVRDWNMFVFLTDMIYRKFVNMSTIHSTTTSHHELSKFNKVRNRFIESNWKTTLALIYFDSCSVTCSSAMTRHRLCTRSCSTETCFACQLFTAKPRSPWRPTSIN